MNFSGLQVFSFVLLLAGTGLIIASIATSNWSDQTFETSDGVSRNVTRGLWSQCVQPASIGNLQQPCQISNRFEGISKSDSVNQGADKFVKEFRIWEIACLALMGSSAVLGLLSLLFSPCCCNRCPCCLVIVVLLATLCCAAGLGTYAYEYTNDPSTQGKVTFSAFSWSFWVAVAGGGCQLFATILFGISRARVQQYSHTI